MEWWVSRYFLLKILTTSLATVHRPFAAVAGRRRISHRGFLIDITCESDIKGMTVGGRHLSFHGADLCFSICSLVTHLLFLHTSLASVRMSAFSKQLPQKRNAIDDGDDVLNHNQDMDIAFNKTQMDLMKGIKDLFDPNGILNPGKIFPDSL